MKDVMLDLETLGTRHDAMIVQIGACYFDRMTGEIGEKFKATIKYRADIQHPYSLDYDTVRFWLYQSESARKSIMQGDVELTDALIGLALFLKNSELIWSHATFDMPILMNAFSEIGLKFPLGYRATRDLRTLMDLAQHKSELPRGGTHHDALDDAIYQSQYAAEAFQKMYGNA